MAWGAGVPTLRVGSRRADDHPMDTASRRVGEFLVEHDVLSAEALEAALAREEREGRPLTAILAGEGLVGETDLLAAIAHQVGHRFVDLSAINVAATVDRAIPVGLAQRHLAVAVAREGDRLVVAMADPGDQDVISALEAAVGPIQPALASRPALERLITAMYGADGLTEAATTVQIDVDVPSDGAQRQQPRDPDLEHSLVLTDLLGMVLDVEGSDLHLTAGSHPVIRVHGDLMRLTEFPVMEPTELRQLIYSILSQKQRETFEAELELDASYSLTGRGRFRVNVFQQRDAIGAVMRAIPFEIVPFDLLGLPAVVADFADLPRGLVLVTGPTGSGKSTTLASLIDIINTTKPVHIMTVEDPIEFLHRHKMGLVNQREVGEDTLGFASALKHVLRQDPDVILVGEMRDLETIQTALTAAETGHLVFGTLHTQDAPQSVDRIIDVFPSHQQEQVRVQLASTLQGVVTQQLVPRLDGAGRVVAAEVLVATPAVRNLVREGKTHQIYSAMQAGGRYGMQTMDQTLAAMVQSGAVTRDAALARCANPDDLLRLVGGGAVDPRGGDGRG